VLDRSGAPTCDQAAGRRTGSGRRGLVLPAVLVMLVALTLMTTAALTLARFEYAAAQAGAHHAGARLAAEYAAADARSGWRTTWADSIPVWGRTLRGRVFLPALVSPGAQAESQWTRASRRLWIARGTGRSGSARAEATQLFWVSDPVTEAVTRLAVASVGTRVPSVVQGTIDAVDLHRVPVPGPDYDCAAATVAFDSLVATRARNRVQRLDSAAVAGLGALPLDSVLARLPDRLAGSGTPGPVVSLGACSAQGGWNWGEPADSSHVCRKQRVTGGAVSSLHVQGGRGQGLLVALSDVTLHDVDFHGLIVTGGRLHVTGTSRVQGAVQAAGGLHLGSRASLEGSACWVAWALDVPMLKPPYRIADAPEWLGR